MLKEETKGIVPCNYSGDPSDVTEVFWNKGPTQSTAKNLVHLLVGGSRNAQGRFNITDDWSLVIDGVEREDHGRYYCEVVKLGSIISNTSGVLVQGMVIFQILSI